LVTIKSLINAKTGRNRVAELLVAPVNWIGPLKSAHADCASILARLVQVGALDVSNEVNKATGETLLHLAVKSCVGKKIIETLLQLRTLSKFTAYLGPTRHLKPSNH
jgi:hypothetical protein